MLFPNDLDRRNQFIAIKQGREALAPAGDLALMPANTLQILLEAPTVADMENLAEEATSRAVTAGLLLKGIHCMDAYGQPEPSMNKAITVIREYANTTLFPDGSRMATSETQIRECWQEFRSVAHLWTALGVGPENLINNDFETYLRAAQSYYHFGVSFVPKRAKPPKPLLDAKTSWSLPSSVRPGRISFANPNLPHGLAQVLRNYKA